MVLHSIEAENKRDVVLAERRHGPLLDVRGALWVLLQGLHDLTVVQHESHELVFPLRLGRRAVDWSDQLQLLQVLEGLRTSVIWSEHEGAVATFLLGFIQTFMMTGCSKLYMELDFL